MKLNTKLAKRLAKAQHSETIRHLMLQTRVDMLIFDNFYGDTWADVEECAKAGESWAIYLMSEFDASF